MKKLSLVSLAFFLSVQVGLAVDAEPTAIATNSNTAVTSPAPTNAPAHPKRVMPPPFVPVPTGTPATPPSDPSKFEIFLLVGQSNMAGRGYLTDADKIADPHVLVLNCADQWVTEGEPIHFDKSVAGVGPGYTFAKLLAAKEPGVTIGLIPCAFGGTNVMKWAPDAMNKKLYPPYNLFNNAIHRTQIALSSGTLKGILWHQGETDATAKDASLYTSRLTPIVASFRKSLNAPNIPFIAGEVGYFGYAKNPFAKTINDQIDTLPTLIANCGVASAEGLVDRGDHLHFSADAQKQLAQRYLDIYLKLASAAPAATPAKP